MVDTSWLFSIAESSATFVAIVSAFFTAKILSIASEKRTIQNRISIVNTELETRKKIVQEYEESISEIRMKWANETIEDFLEDLSYEVETNSVPSLDQLLKKFEEKEGRPANKYEVAALEQQFSVFKSVIEAKIKEERVGREQEKVFPWLSGIYDLTRGLRIPALERITIPQVLERQVRELDELYDKYDAEMNQISVLQGTKARYEEQLASVAFPRFIKFGFFSQIYFALGGVLIPLTYTFWQQIFGSSIDIFVLSTFTSGLALTFTYIGLEIRDAISKKVS